jgi:hypothetical protein
MSESRPVPRVVLLDGKCLPAPLHTEWRCHVCNFPACAMSDRAVSEAMDAHTMYVNTHFDRATDPHFAERRLDRLMQA